MSKVYLVRRAARLERLTAELGALNVRIAELTAVADERCAESYDAPSGAERRAAHRAELKARGRLDGLTRDRMRLERKIAALAEPQTHA